MTPPSLLSPRVQAVIALVLLVMFAGVLFVPVFAPAYKIDPASQQALFTLVVMAVSFYLGSSSGSAKKDDQNAALTAQLAATPPSTPTPVVQPAAPLPATYPIELSPAAYAVLLKDGWTDAQIIAAGMKIPATASLTSGIKVTQVPPPA